MLSELPKIFGRNFLVAFALPSALLLAANLQLFAGFGYPSTALPTKEGLLTDATLFGVVTWVIGILLSFGNVNILRLMEGYGRLNPARLFKALESRRFEKLQKEIPALNAELESCLSQNKKFPQQSRFRRNELLQQAAVQFPDQDWILPTSFGNAIRAFEVYPRVMYGLEGIEGWIRLLTVIPKEYLRFLDDSRAQMDMWANLFFIPVVLELEYLALAVFTRKIPIIWLPISAAVLAVIAFSMAKGAAIQWGELVKSSFDVFLPELRKKLGFPRPSSKDEERQLWTRFSQAIIYRLPGSLPDKSPADGITHHN